MSLSNALSNALSGLTAASRGTEVVASNLANATTPGFARRELQLTSRPVIAGGGGVQVEGVTRVLRNSVVAQGRLAEAETVRAGTLAAFHRTLSDAVGVPGEAGALSTALSDFDSALLAVQQEGLRRHLPGLGRRAFDRARFEIHRPPRIERHERADRESPRDRSDEALDAVFVPDPAPLKVGQLDDAAMAFVQQPLKVDRISLER